MSGRMKKYAVVFAVVAILVLCVVALFLQRQKVGAYAVVRVDGKELVRLSLTENTEYPVCTALGENLVVVEDGTVYVRTADCPEQICVHQGKVRYSGESIVCLPHHLVVTVEGTADTPSVDVVV